MVAGPDSTGAIGAHSARCLSLTWRSPERHGALTGIGAADDVPIARRLMVCGEPEDRFERDMPVEAAVVAEDELVEVRVDMPNRMLKKSGVHGTSQNITESRRRLS